MITEFNINDTFQVLNQLEEEYNIYNTNDFQLRWGYKDAKYLPVLFLYVKINNNELHNKELINALNNNFLFKDWFLVEHTWNRRFEAFGFEIFPHNIGFFTVEKMMEMKGVSRQSINRNKKKYESITYGLNNRNKLYREKLTEHELIKLKEN